MRGSVGIGSRWGHWAAGIMASLLIGCAPALRLAPEAYPPTPRESLVERLHGTDVADPYRYLEDLDAPRTTAWVAAQNKLSAAYLGALPLHEGIRARLAALYDYARDGVPRRAGGRYFFLHNEGQQNQAALFVSDSPRAPGRRLIDPDGLRGDATVSLGAFVPSPDGRLLAYSLSDGGSDWRRWYVRDVDSGVDLPDVLVDTKFTEASWSRDSRGFFYSRYPQGNDQRQPAIYYHRVGEPQAQDRLVYSVKDHPTRVPEGVVSQDGAWLVVSLEEGTLHSAVTAVPLAGGSPRVVFDGSRGYYEYLGSDRAQGTQLYFRTTDGAPRGRVIAVDLGEGAGVREVVPERPATLDQAALIGDTLIAVYLKDAHAEVWRHAAASGLVLGRVELPGIGSVSGFTGDSGSSETFYGYTDFFTPTRIFRLDAATGAAEPLRSPRIAADVSSYTTEQVFYTSRDGTRVPMFLVHRRDLKRDGRTPVMLYGYGGFDISLTPSFSPATLLWLQMGGIYAVANLRGGGEYGEPWHEAGTRTRKQNVFDDFIAAARYLIASGYTRPSRIVIRGGSNGGLLVAAALTQHPELFGAALPDVGVLDMLRYHLASANARLWADDYGLSDDEADFRALLAYSPYHNVARHHCYPPTLVTTASQDNRVVPWHSYKFTAALQRAQRCARPALLRVETRAGHGAGKPLWMQVEHQADQWAFAAAALGMKLPPQSSSR